MTNSKNKTSLMALIAVALLCIVAAVGIGVCFWPEQQTHSSNPSEDVAIADSLNQIGEAFLEKIAQEPGVEALGGGVYYKVIQEGNGPKPAQESTVKVNYEGRLIDGTVFDSSYERGEPASFPVSGVITGWQIALKAMPVGSTWEIYIPQYYAYGAQGSGKNIPPYSALVFKVELLEIMK